MNFTVLALFFQVQNKENIKNDPLAVGRTNPDLKGKLFLSLLY